jgi:L-asparagine oxygenase
VAGSELALSNEGSLVDLGMHTEAAIFLLRPHFILLVCLRGDAQGDARTTVASATVMCRHLNPETLAVLRAPVFQLRAPQSFDNGLGEVRWSEPRPILAGPAELPEICVNLNGVRATTPQAEQALAAVHTVLQRPGVVQSVCLTPGDMLVVNNRKALHGRTPFTPRFDGRDRWLQRCYVRSDLWDGRTNPGAPIRVF